LLITCLAPCQSVSIHKQQERQPRKVHRITQQNGRQYIVEQSETELLRLCEFNEFGIRLTTILLLRALNDLSGSRCHTADWEEDI